MTLPEPKMEIRPIDSLVKVFADEELSAAPYTEATALIGEVFSFQLAIRAEGFFLPEMKAVVDSPIQDAVTVYEVALVPSELPVIPPTDEYCLRRTPGLYPDLLRPLTKFYKPILGAWCALWVQVDLSKEGVAAGKKQIAVSLAGDTPDGEKEFGKAVFTLHVIDARLPEQQLINTNWFHGDCIADYYKIPVFSEKHWEYLENFMRVGAKYGNNMILTPLFTPPLDTAVGGERTTIQLVDVVKHGCGTYSFGFSNLLRWVETARRAGVKYFEMSHLFTQWGAKHAPKIIARIAKTGGDERIFGWETDAAGEEYRRFLEQFIPELKEFLAKNNMRDCTYFHVSDEPQADMIEQYRLVGDHFRELVRPYPVMDALSDIEFYLSGAVEHPIPASNHIGPFLEAKVPDLWTYYCVGQFDKVSNRFFGMPSERNRVIGAQMYKFNIAGFLQWGYCFYNSVRSTCHIDPFKVTDANRGFPSGDAFMVYPGEEGALPSLRMLVFNEGLQDMRALKLAERLAGREKVISVLEEGIEPITFESYPHSRQWLLSMRAKINELIRENL